jgi:FHS family Na+ dependent glucose MFS transporter 1
MSEPWSSASWPSSQPNNRQRTTARINEQYTRITSKFLMDDLNVKRNNLLANATSFASSDKIIKTAAYCLAFVSLGLVASSLGPTLPSLAENTRTQFREISYLFIARSFGYMLGSLLGGRLYDRLAGHLVMGGALLVMAATMLLAPLIPLLLLLVTVLLILGIAEGFIDVGGNTLLVWLHRSKVGPFMNALHFAFGLGAFLGPIVIAQVMLRIGAITWAYWMLALLIIPSALWLLYLSSPPIQTGAEDGSTPRINYLLLFLIAFFFFLYVGAEIGFGGWVFSYAVALNLTTEAYAAYLTSGFWGALTVGRLLAIPIAARLRPRTILLGDLAGCLLSVALILLWPGSFLAIWLGTIGLGLSMASIFPVTLSFAERRMTITGNVTGFFLVGASLGGMSMPWLIGQLFEPIGPQVAMWIIMANLVADLAVLIILIVYSGRLVVMDE